MERRQIEKVKEIIKIKHEINKLEHGKKKSRKSTIQRAGTLKRLVKCTV